MEKTEDLLGNLTEEKKKKKSKWKIILLIVAVLLICIGVGTTIVVLKLNSNKEEPSNQSKDNQVEEKTENSQTSEKKKDEKEIKTEGDKSGILLEDAPGLSGKGYEIKEEIKDSYGQIFLEGIELSAHNGGNVACSLNGNYLSLEGKLVVSDNTESGSIMDFVIFVDDKPVFTRKDLTRQSAEEIFKVDLEGAQNLLIRIRSNESVYSVLDLVETKLVKNKENSPPEKYATLMTVPQIDAEGSEKETGLFKDNYGNLYNGDIVLRAGNSGYAAFNLDNKYKKFSCKLTSSNQTASNSLITIQVYLDDELVKEIKDIKKTDEPQLIELDVLNKKVIKITSLSQVESVVYANSYIVDSRLTE